MQSVGKGTMTKSAAPASQLGQALTNKELEAKMSSLERAMDDKDKTIAELLEKIQDLSNHTDIQQLS